MVCGRRGDTAGAARSLQAEGTAVVHHDLSLVGEGVVARSVTTVEDGVPVTRSGIVELAHACVSCTLREDLLPLLRRLAQRDGIDRIVVELDPMLEPEPVCWAIREVVVAGLVGAVDAPAAHDVRIEAVLACVDAETWLADALGDEPAADAVEEEGLVDERTVAQIVVGQVSVADAILVTGSAGDGWEQARLYAVLARLAPGAPVAWGSAASTPTLVAAVPPTALRGAATTAFSPLLRGQPPLDDDLGVSLVEFEARRPFHPGRLHDALDVLFDGVVTARGRLWIATQPGTALWLESAGGGLRVGDGGPWMAALSPDEQDALDAERRAHAALHWADPYGDRHNALVVLVCGADPDDVRGALHAALVTDAEFADPAQWADWNDPFGSFHEDPCEPGLSDAEPRVAARPDDQENR
nr:GTP-binding protein [Rhodococcus sp. HNM0569]